MTDTQYVNESGARAEILAAYDVLKDVLLTPVQGHALVEIVNLAAAVAADSDSQLAPSDPDGV
jgi:hypothetical protein